MKQVDENTYQLDERTLLERRKGKWRLVYPIKINGKICKKNLFRMDWFALGMIALLLLVSFMYYRDMSKLSDLIANPCKSLAERCAGAIIP
jgi:hypothetical protein